MKIATPMTRNSNGNGKGKGKGKCNSSGSETGRSNLPTDFFTFSNPFLSYSLIQFFWILQTVYLSL